MSIKNKKKLKYLFLKVWRYTIKSLLYNGFIVLIIAVISALALILEYLIILPIGRKLGFFDGDFEDLFVEDFIFSFSSIFLSFVLIIYLFDFTCYLLIRYKVILFNKLKNYFKINKKTE